MDSIYFRDPMGLLVEFASYKFEPPQGATHARMRAMAQLVRLARKAGNIEDEDVANAIAEPSLNHPKNLAIWR